jgi:hypothetical protein
MIDDICTICILPCTGTSISAPGFVIQCDSIPFHLASTKDLHVLGMTCDLASLASHRHISRDGTRSKLGDQVIYTLM